MSKEERTEAERRTILYDSLVRAQRRYAAKLSTADGPQGYFTEQQWTTLGEEFAVEDWDAGFIREDPYPGKNWEMKTTNIKTEKVKKENMPMWKGKGKAMDVDSDDEDVATLTMVF